MKKTPTATPSSVNSSPNSSPNSGADAGMDAPLSLCVFCGSSPGNRPDYVDIATETGRLLAEKNIRLVYGGGGLGLMGATARAAHENGGRVLGIIPEFLMAIEETFDAVEHRIVPDMHARKIQMFQESDGFIVLPGGLGTLEEAVEVMSWLRLSLHKKPVVFLNHNGYWEPLSTLLEHTITAEFSPEDLRDRLCLVETPKAAIEETLARIRAPLPEMLADVAATLSDI